LNGSRSGAEEVSRVVASDARVELPEVCGRAGLSATLSPDGRLLCDGMMPGLRFEGPS
jgi:hypothetical protein